MHYSQQLHFRHIFINIRLGKKIEKKKKVEGKIKVKGFLFFPLNTIDVFI